ncbi:MAG: hypothetical protein LBK60_07920 [Verrucomicrobiales bacterium]|jgi:hypothetical protein|nr:hypothetical protein [Verrucomicrobiales bacterium]
MHSFSSSPVVPLTDGKIVINEKFGLNHRRQLVTVSVPPGVTKSTKLLGWRDTNSGKILTAQRSRENPTLAFMSVELCADEHYRLAAGAAVPRLAAPLSVRQNTRKKSAVISSDTWAVEVFLGEWKSAGGGDAPAPVRRVSVSGGPWRGRAFFDTRKPIVSVNARLVEYGSLRVVVEHTAATHDKTIYTARLTFDADSDFIRVEENFDAGSGDQIVWDFSGGDLPTHLHLLDHGGGHTTLPVEYFFDRRFARLACWNQFSQLHDFSDGYALKFADADDAIGFVVLGGGHWRGNAHNFLEAWSRRWLPGDADSRRLVPPDAKADGSLSPELIPARPVNNNEPHFSVEGWLHHGHRSWALVLTKQDALLPADYDPTPLAQFEHKPAHDRYRRQQGLLRRIWIQHGLLPLSEQLAITAVWPQEPAPASLGASAPWQHPDRPEYDFPRSLTVSQRIEVLMDQLAARMYGCWEGSGAAYSNPVVSRRLAGQELPDWEWLAANGHLTEAQRQRGRAWFAWLCALFHSDNYYIGGPSMNMGDPDDSLEPTMAGMANQNFYTDVFNFPALAAQIFPGHPDAPAWREKFTTMWNRQLAYHVYPDSGVWEESHTYYHHVLFTVLPTLLRRRDDGVGDGFADPQFHRMVGALLAVLSPRDANFGGKRHAVALGDHGVDLRDIYRLAIHDYAEAIAPSNKPLAAALGWAYREMNGDRPLTVKPVAPPWRDSYVRGLGYFFRAQAADGGETLLVLRNGAAWGHHHNDEGSIQLFADGRAWIVDSAFSNPQAGGRKVAADGHSRWSPRDFAPLNYLWQFNRGWLTQHADGDAALPFAVAYTPVFMAQTAVQQYVPLGRAVHHWRAVVRLSPLAFLVLDRSDCDLAQVTRYHVPLNATMHADSAGSRRYLRLQALRGLERVPLIHSDAPAQPEVGAGYATQEILFNVSDAEMSALLIQVTDMRDSLPAARCTGDTLTLTHKDFNVSVRFGASGKVTVSDQKSGKKVELMLNHA